MKLVCRGEADILLMFTESSSSVTVQIKLKKKNKNKKTTNF